MLVVPSPPMPGGTLRPGRGDGTPQFFVCPGGALHSREHQCNAVCLEDVERDCSDSRVCLLFKKRQRRFFSMSSKTAPGTSTAEEPPSLRESAEADSSAVCPTGGAQPSVQDGRRPTRAPRLFPCGAQCLPRQSPGLHGKTGDARDFFTHGVNERLPWRRPRPTGGGRGDGPRIILRVICHRPYHSSNSACQGRIWGNHSILRAFAF
jgi:hypothetical protein